MRSLLFEYHRERTYLDEAKKGRDDFFPILGLNIIILYAKMRKKGCVSVVLINFK